MNESLKQKANKWELVEEGVPFYKSSIFFQDPRPVICDVYRRLKRDGTYKYKTIDRYND